VRLDGGLRRRWFTDEDLDLYLWFDERGGLLRMQLCYDKRGRERVLSWRRGQGFRHDRIDDGEGVPGKARSPILVIDGGCDAVALLRRFREASLQLNDEVFDLVYERLVAFKHRF
jgi:hypothetical protein